VDRIPIFWGGGLLEPVARRWKTQINENAKTAAYFEAMPELNHNAVVGLEFPEPLMTRIAIVQLVSRAYDHPRVKVRHEASTKIVLQSGIMSDRVTARGESRLAQQMSMIQFGDYLSYYLAMAYEVDPTPIHNIDQLKQRLSEVE
jgi:glucose/mannose-6-phosphate isomerase